MIEKEKWVKHYSSSHQILLVGEGDFSFSLSLAIGFGSAYNLFATSFDSYDTLVKSYKKASLNLRQLELMGATLLHEVDARLMKDHPLLNKIKFDRIVYNFPHAGFYGKEDNPFMIKMHQELVLGFFSNARWLLRPNGQIHITHKTKSPYSYWNLEELASKNSLRLNDCVAFDIKDYPFYENKRGHGSTSDEPFYWRDSCTFKFSVEPLSTHIQLSYREALPRVKFIVKAEVEINSGAAGYAGALWDENHTIRAMFCGPLPCYIMDTNVAELLAIKVALLMFERSELCCRNVELVVESESNHAVSWIKSHFGNPREVLVDLQEINMVLNRVRNHVQFCCGYKEYGDESYRFVHELANKAMLTNKMYEAWFPNSK
ncbi:hypothetical protein BVRB_8g199620 [Beta vulgaris subsp. vulgaris]|uniref:25S rRNA (uridine-N(3))-methyltransferase BMT5-like domain-containing protein n=1 Tax=Beta vulgaris subsp. vulgaris TaxID=3555 RepID=A0A0J8B693_BETVV|nr:hypothetical protein BVRB_8g199620 [Beta vulgaris subsp. vulgaris]